MSTGFLLPTFFALPLFQYLPTAGVECILIRNTVLATASKPLPLPRPCPIIAIQHTSILGDHQRVRTARPI